MTSAHAEQPDPTDAVRSAFAILVAGGPEVAQALLDIATSGKSEIARVQAATAVLDRIGLHGRVDIGISATSLLPAATANAAESSAVEMIKQRLSLLHAQMMTHSADDPPRAP